MQNINSGFGGFVKAQFSAGKHFLVSTSSQQNHDNLSNMFKVDNDGTVRVFSTITSALSACVSGRGDTIYIHPGFTTALTAAELLAAETKGVRIINAATPGSEGEQAAYRATATLPATTATPYFTVTGKIKLLSIIGEVTTIVQTQACNAKLIANPTVGADVDLCAVLDITASAVGSQFSITGTLANAMVKTTSGAGVFQASPLLILPGTIDFSTSATNTGATKWQVRYIPIDPGARVFSA